MKRTFPRSLRHRQPFWLVRIHCLEHNLQRGEDARHLENVWRCHWIVTRFPVYPTLNYERDYSEENRDQTDSQ